MTKLYATPQVKLTTFDYVVLEAVRVINQRQMDEPFSILETTREHIQNKAKKTIRENGFSHINVSTAVRESLDKLVHLKYLSLTEQGTKTLYFLTDAGQKVLEDRPESVAVVSHGDINDYQGPRI